MTGAGGQRNALHHIYKTASGLPSLQTNEKHTMKNENESLPWHKCPQGSSMSLLSERQYVILERDLDLSYREVVCEGSNTIHSASLNLSLSVTEISVFTVGGIKWSMLSARHGAWPGATSHNDRSTSRWTNGAQFQVFLKLRSGGQCPSLWRTLRQVSFWFATTALI